MNEIRFRIDAERMTFDDFIAVVEGTMSEKRNVMARFVVDDAGAYLPEVDGRKRIGSLPLGQVKRTIESFLDQFNQVNPPNGAA